MPQIKDATRVVRNQRPDKKFQYKVTLSKAMGDRASNGLEVNGRFSLFTGERSPEDFDNPELFIYFEETVNPQIGTQRNLLGAKWEKAHCLSCGRPVEPIFPPDSSEISYVMDCECGGSYFCDKRDSSSVQYDRNPREHWEVLHNYDPKTGMYATNLEPDFDVFNPEAELAHLFCSKGIAALPNDFPLRVLDSEEIERLMKKI